ncbi:MAG: amphi-Trp domain-containing protein [Nitrospinae bacterium]|nr:amphi-Trp domain-containing protein [Nitrospinota bacterium]
MSKNDDQFGYESLQDRESIVKYLAALNEGFAAGQLLFGSRQKQLALAPQGLIKFDVEGKRKDGQVKLKMKFSWKEESRPLTDSEDGSFVIKGATNG